MKTTDARDNDILDKQEVERDAKEREEILKDTLISRNSIKESQQTLFPREDENKQQAKITVHTIEEAMTTNKERTPVSVWFAYNNASFFCILDFFGALVMLLLSFTFDW